MENKYEAHIQLLLVANILNSTIGTFAAFLAVVIGKVDVQNLFEKHKEQLPECNLWGKIALASTALPVFPRCADPKVTWC